MTTNNINDNTEQFKQLLRSTQRVGIESVIQNLETLGFFQAPASAGHHLNVPGGLVQHSLNVCRKFPKQCCFSRPIWNNIHLGRCSREFVTAKKRNAVGRSEVFLRNV